MGLLARAVAEQKGYDTLDLFREIYGGKASKAGPTITLENALKVATLFACLKVLSQGVAQVPMKLFREQTIDGLKKIEPARDHPHYDLVATQPNDWSSSFEFRETLTLHAALGNAYVFKNRLMGGRVAEMILLNPGRVEKVQAEDYSIAYKVTGKSGATQIFPAEAIWHVRGPSWDGLIGMDVLNIARDALGLAIATEESHAALHKKGVRTSGTYTVEKTLNKEQYATLKAWILAEMAGADNSGAPMILDNGAKWISGAMTGVDAQHLETRNHQISEVCRFTGVSPFMIFQTDKAPTYASAEQFQIQHVVHTLSPWYARIEQSADINLLTKKERAAGYYFKFVAAGLLRGAMKDQGEFFARMMGAGGTRQILTQDEVRELLEFNPMGGDAGLLHAPQGSQTSDPAPTAA